MNMMTVIVTVLVLIVVLIGAFKIRQVAHSKETDSDVRPLALWGWRFLFVIFLVGCLGTVQVSGLVKIPDPFQGPRITNELPARSLSPPVAETPELKGVPMQPNFDEVADGHQTELNEFEDKSPE